MEKEFKLKEFYQVWDAERLSRNLSWDQVSEQTGISRTTIYRIRKGENVRTDKLAIASVWSGISLKDYIPDIDDSDVSSITKIVEFIYSDPKLSDEAKACLATMMKTAYESLIAKV